MTKRLPGMEGPSWEGLSVPAIRIRQGSLGGQTGFMGQIHRRPLQVF